jgi:hypothetical protein
VFKEVIDNNDVKWRWLKLLFHHDRDILDKNCEMADVAINTGKFTDEEICAIFGKHIKRILTSWRKSKARRKSITSKKEQQPVNESDESVHPDWVIWDDGGIIFDIDSPYYDEETAHELEQMYKDD